MHYPLRLKLGAVAAVFCFVTALGVVSLIFWRQGSLVPMIGSDAGWVAYKLDRETVELRSQLLRSRPGSTEDLDELRLSFDLLYSRTQLLRDGQIGDLIHAIPTVDGLIAPILDRVARLDDDIRSLETLTPAVIDRLQERFHALGGDTQRLVMAINEHFAQTKTTARETMFKLYTLLLALIVLMSLATLVVVRFLFQEARDNDASRRTLETLSRELEVTARRAESASRAKSDFLAIVSHEIRTPLNGVIGMSALLLDRQRDPRSRHYARTIHESAEILLSLINDILDFSKIEAGRLELEVEAFDLTRCIDSVIQLFTPRLEDSPVRLERDIDPALPPCLSGDAGRLRQILLNLLSNALKFTAVGEVRLSVGACGEGRVRFEVSDTGCGIPAERRDVLFEPFRQGDASTARRYGGSGLGLAICKRLVTAMGGDIGFESREHQGSRFWFELPLEAADASAVSAPAPALFPERHEAGLAGRLLVAEDNPVNRQVAVAMLERFGLEAEVAEDGRSAVEMAARGGYDLIFMDMQMPGMDGIAATRRIRQLAGAAGQVPIVAMTAGALEGEKSRALAAGMDGYLTKPILPDQLERLLRRYLGDAASAPTESAGAEAANDVLVDRHLLAEFERSLGREGLEELVQLFRAQVPERLARLDAALMAGDDDALRRQAHLLKGESSGLGLRRVAALAGALERQVAQLGEAARRQRIDTLRRTLDETLGTLRRSGPAGARR
ncbi:ATP-binding protein [Modicisalibacter coralii]|uniref:ATP-binding protein n=1 Tax=Modicisalibacter coralii TaxID=2304602 RepID=UPI001F469E6C|nr:ATP-binding protein [Halomonas coralii]